MPHSAVAGNAPVRTEMPQVAHITDSIKNIGGGNIMTTPISGKRNFDAIALCTPDNMLSLSTTSPGSKTKILASGEISVRLMISEEEINVNMKPWDHDSTESPVNKQVLVAGRLAKSPWFYGYCHKTCSASEAAEIYEKSMGLKIEELERCWPQDSINYIV